MYVYVNAFTTHTESLSLSLCVYLSVCLSVCKPLSICSFSFAPLPPSHLPAGPGAVYTDYVATRWYRAPELLVGDTQYGSPVDIWAVGCVFAEMLTCRPLWPGKSDIDQIFHIIQTLGPLIPRHVHIFSTNAYFSGLQIPEPQPETMLPLEARFRSFDPKVVSFLKACLTLEPADRADCTQLLEHSFFDGFRDWFEPEITELLRSPREQRRAKKPIQTPSRRPDSGRGRHLPTLGRPVDGTASFEQVMSSSQFFSDGESSDMQGGTKASMHIKGVKDDPKARRESHGKVLLPHI